MSHCFKVWPVLLACIWVGAACAAGDTGLPEEAKSGTKRTNLVIYNRVPKSGSSSIQEHVNRLSRDLGYLPLHFVKPPAVKCPKSQLPCLSSESLSPNIASEVERFIKHVVRLVKTRGKGKPMMIDYHFPFVDFAAFNQTAPVYINTMRDPVHRLLSHYFYVRNGPRPESLRNEAIRLWGNLTVEECLAIYRRCKCSSSSFGSPNPLAVAPALAQCTKCTKNQCTDLFYSFNTQMMFFCTWGSPACTQKGKKALAEAKRVLSTHYDVVGILEHMKESMEVFEAALPSMFKGMSEHELLALRTNGHQGGPGEEAMKELYELNALDMDFYRFASDRLLAQHKRMDTAGLLPKGVGHKHTEGTKLDDSATSGTTS